MRIDLTVTEKRILRAAAVTSVAIAILGVGFAIAAPHQWATSDPLKATDLNGLNVLSTTTDAGTFQISVGATKFCGVSATTTTGAITYAGLMGYPAAKKTCEAAPGCSPTAHMCSSEELTRTLQAGMSIPGTPGSVIGWYAGGLYTAQGSDEGSDCSSYTNGSGGSAPSFSGSALYLQTSGVPTTDNPLCNNSLPILCCD